MAPGGACNAPSDCVAGAACRDNICRATCSMPEECAPGEGCRDNYCQACEVAANCPGEYACDSVSGACRTECRAEADCKDSGYCANDRRCVRREPDGAWCSRAVMCTHGNCLDSACCPEGCTTSCLGGQCLGDIGAACNEDTECDSGNCAEHTCCNQACEAPCYTCLGAVPGTCEPVAFGPDDACNTSCADGICLAGLGNYCAAADDCDSGFCTDHVCCDTACDDSCEQCAGSTPGTCQSVTMREIEDCSIAPNDARMCDADGACMGPHGLGDVNGFAAPSSFIRLSDGTILFSANKVGRGREPWIYTPATGSARMLRDTKPGPDGGSISGFALTDSGKSAYISAGGTLYRATALLTPISPYYMGGTVSSAVAALGEEAVLAVTPPDEAQRLYLTRGDVALSVSVNSSYATYPSYLTRMGDSVYAKAAVDPDGYVLVRISPTSQTLVPISGGTVASSPVYLAAMNGNLYFAAYSTSSAKRELYRFSGSGSPELLRDVAPGTTNSGVSTIKVVPSADLVYFLARDAVSTQVWVSSPSPNTGGKVIDLGTTASPRLLDASSTHFYFSFTYEYSSTANSLWATALSTTLGATQVSPVGKDFDVFWTYPDGPRLWMAANDHEHGVELWRVEGASPATLFDLWPGAIGSEPSAIGVVNGELYFAATDETHGRDLWKCDVDAPDPSAACVPIELIAGSGSAFIAAPSTKAATMVSGTDLIFPALSATGGPWWLYRISETGRVAPLVEIDWGNDASNPSSFVAAPAISGAMFLANDGVHGTEPWSADAEGVRLLADTCPGSASATMSWRQGLGDQVFMRLTCPDSSAAELWRTSGTPVSTTKVAGLVVDTPQPVVMGSRLALVTPSGAGRCIALSDGTPTGTSCIADGPANGFTDPSDLTLLGDQLYFSTVAAAVRGLWAVSGTAVSSIGTFANVSSLFTAGDRLYFAASDATNGKELWATNCAPGQTCGVVSCDALATTRGYCLVGDFCAGACDSSPRALAHANGLLYFTANGSRELWVTDGTAAGTHAMPAICSQAAAGGVNVVSSVVPLREGRVAVLVSCNNYLNAYGGIWIIQGTDAWLWMEGGSSMASFNRNVYTSAFSELWVTDGTSEGTFTACAQDKCRSPSNLVVTGNRLYMSLDTGFGGEPAVFP